LHEKSHRRMQTVVDQVFPQALGLFEPLQGEEQLVRSGVFPGNQVLRTEWLEQVVPVLNGASSSRPSRRRRRAGGIACRPEEGGRRGQQGQDLRQLVDDMQMVCKLAPSAKW